MLLDCQHPVSKFKHLVVALELHGGFEDLSEIVVLRFKVSVFFLEGQFLLVVGQRLVVIPQGFAGANQVVQGDAQVLCLAGFPFDGQHLLVVLQRLLVLLLFVIDIAQAGQKQALAIPVAIGSVDS